MMPSIDDRLQSMQRALQEVILPALAPEESLAVEQAHLLLGHLAVIREQFDLALVYERAECASTEELGRQLLAQAAGGQRTLAAASALRQAADAPAPATAQHVRDRTIALSLAVEALMDASGIDGTDAFLASSAQAVITSNDRTSQRDRSWFRSMGFERGESALPPVAEILGVQS